MDILLTNDDGPSGPGICALRRRLAERGRVTVVCPAEERSGVAHAITFLTSVHAEPVRLADGAEALALSGTPADCVKFALAEVLEREPDLIVSGLNPGINAGIAVLYSGTVAAVLEGALYGVPSVAFSTVPEAMDEPDAVAAAAMRVLDLLQAEHWPAGLAYNVNIPRPDGPAQQVRFTRQDLCAAWRRYRREDGADGRPRYWLSADGERGSCALDSDVEALRNGQVSITPLRPDLTDAAALSALAERAGVALGSAGQTGGEHDG